MKKINWGILGAANIAYEQVVPAIRRSERAFVSAVASRTKEKAERFNTPEIYDTYEEMLNDDSIDAVYIPLPNALHKEWAVKALNAEKHVLLEKPAALTAEEMVEIKAAADENNVIFIEAFMYQYHQQHQRVKELLDSKIIGEFRHLKAHFSWMLHHENDIRLNQELGGGAMWDVGCYGVHAVTQIFGMKPIKVSMSGNIHPDYHVDLTSTTVFIDEQHRTAEVSASMELPFIDRYEAIGPKGSLLVESAFRPDVSADQRGKVTVKDIDGNIILLETFQSDQYLNQIEHFQDCIIEGKKPIYDAEDSIEITRYIERSYQSLYNDSVLKNI
ncbi:Gfo/Idh/MocA family oxidoreductase [Oceanobacillus oncorhynchi subsp. oncorhynchi]|uniref:Gfo/Idh/MocA family protein n=1 Tax=Oceanobacillus oncorhynchi TaxID=545501 RepID=UPI0031DAD5EF